MIFDTHIHTKYSSDSKMDIEEVIRKVKSINIGAIITDHHDVYSFRDKEACRSLNADKYLKDYEKYRSETLLIGIEIGLSECNIEDNKEMVNRYPFDYVIGSLHTVCGLDIYPEFKKGEDSKITNEMYLEQSIKMVEKGDFDALGHIDYPARVSELSDKEISYNKNSEKYDKLFKTLIEKEIVLEINTKRLGYEENIPNIYNIYKRYFELGGKYVTIGSDAHIEKHIGNNFKTAKNIIKEIGLIPIYFKDRKKERC